MTIRVEFLDGATEKRVSPLYQWDFGQMLEIVSPDFPSIVEVHFGCPQLQEAIVHACSVVNGVASVRIPDRCLEQSGVITAWVYEIRGNAGSTTKVVYIPMISRTRPARTQEVPEEVSDKYTELINEVNEVVTALTEGNITVASAVKAINADRATQADNASVATYSLSSQSAQNATCDENGYNIYEHYVSFVDDFSFVSMRNMPGVGTHQFKVCIEDVWFQTILTITEDDISAAILGLDSSLRTYILTASTAHVDVSAVGNETFSPDIYYRTISFY